MTPKQLRNKLENLLDQLMDLDVAILRTPIVVESKARRSYVGFRAKNPRMHATEFGTVSEYYAELERDAYSCILCDGSILQMSYEVEGTRLRGHRLAYYPCPCNVDPEVIANEPIAEVVEMYAAELDNFRLRSPVRFDYAPEQAGQDHPHSHLHINHSECRCAVSAPLMPVEFIRFVVRNFYPDVWGRCRDLRKATRDHVPRVISEKDERELHLSCRTS